MPISDFAAGDVVRVPFPYTDRDTRQHRPALVVSSKPLGDEGTLLWVLMITSAENRSWPDDIALDANRGETGLRVPSLIRPCKIATVEAARADRLGRITPTLMAEVSDRLRHHLGI